MLICVVVVVANSALQDLRGYTHFTVNALYPTSTRGRPTHADAASQLTYAFRQVSENGMPGSSATPPLSSAALTDAHNFTHLSDLSHTSWQAHSRRASLLSIHKLHDRLLTLRRTACTRAAGSAPAPRLQEVHKPCGARYARWRTQVPLSFQDAGRSASV